MPKVFVPTSLFKKQLKKLPDYVLDSLKEVLLKFEANEMDPTLKNHRLKGEYSDYRSINITGDWRLIYERSVVTDTYRLIAIGTHSELYR